jgi:glycerate kinase
MRLVIAPDSFKDCLSASAVCDAVAQGARRADPEIEIFAIPMADGGQGTLDSVLRATGGRRQSVEVVGPLGEPVVAALGFLDDGQTAIFEMASASGLELVPVDKRDACTSTTFGTGQLLVAALDAGARRVLVGIGGSATNDGGAGLAEALGYRLLDRQGKPIPRGGGGLDRLERIDAAGRHPRIGQVAVEVACDVTNPLTGPTGASAVYGPQKGASPEQVERLDRNLAHLAAVVRRDLGLDVEHMPGAGAAGGLGAGLVAFAGARLARGVELVLDAVRFRERVQGADLCITGEGALDAQTAYGKTAYGVARACREAGVPCVALVGAVRGDLTVLFNAGLTAAFSATPRPASLAEALADAEGNIAHAAEQIVRLFLAAAGSHPDGGNS